MAEGLDWTQRRHWNKGRKAPCRLCGKPALLLDGSGTPCHKVCAEAEIERAVQRQGSGR